MGIQEYIPQASEAVTRLLTHVRLQTVILDDWRGVRLIHGYPCSGDCQTCGLFQAVGEDVPGEARAGVRITLIAASPDDLSIFPHRQRFLNCKTPAQYADCFAAWLAAKCMTPGEIEEELELVRGFQILHAAGVGDLAALERSVKRQVVPKTLALMPKNDERRVVLLQIAKAKGLSAR